MIIHLAPGTPAVLHVAATAVLFTHIGAGVVGLLSGAGALIVRKGGQLHRLSGRVFVAAIMVMGVVGALAAPLLPQRSSVIPGMFVAYLVATAMLTVKQRSAWVRGLEGAALLWALVAVALGVLWGVQAGANPKGVDGDGPATFYVFGTLVAFAAVLDVRTLIAGGLIGSPRLRRHLWRMCTALLIAAFSFFLGQSQVFPSALRNTVLLMLPELAILGALIFWMVRTRRSGRMRRQLGLADGIA